MGAILVSCLVLQFCIAVGGQDSRYLNDKTAKFVVNRTNFPYVPFDIGESYGGLLPVSESETEDKQLYFWFSPSSNPAASDEITIWLNGGPGCSSLIGLLSENGNFLWLPGTSAPVQNDWAWTRLTNMVWIDQPAGTGYAVGKPTALGTDDVAEQFLGFWRNFVDVFDLAGRKVFIAGESFAGKYIPYIASAMLLANDTHYFNVAGTMLIDPALTLDVTLVEIPMLSFAEDNQAILGYNDSFRAYMRDVHARRFNYTAFFSTYFRFPPAAPRMPIPPNWQEGDSPFRQLLTDAATRLNPCFNVLHILDHCPPRYDPVQGPWDAARPDLGSFFNLSAVRAASNARGGWAACTDTDAAVFAGARGADQAPPASAAALPRMFDGVPLNVVASGARDMLIPAAGTLFALQNVTWRGATGFAARPARPFVVPPGPGPGSGPAGEMGAWALERGVLFVAVAGAGHLLPRDNPSAAFRLLEVLLGRVGVEEGMAGGAGWSVGGGR